jgi:hypothetical protein
LNEWMHPWVDLKLHGRYILFLMGHQVVFINMFPKKNFLFMISHIHCT